MHTRCRSWVTPSTACTPWRPSLSCPSRSARYGEMMRVTRPCGALCINEADHDSNHLLTTDIELGHRVQRFVAEHEYNGAVPRQIVGWLKEAGWQVRYELAVGTSEELS